MKHYLHLPGILVMAMIGNPLLGQDDMRKLSLHSEYLSSPLGRARQVILSAELNGTEGTGSLKLDPNNCTLNEFGDRQACTLIAAIPQDIVLILIRQDDNPGRNRQLWELNGAQIQGHLFLVIPTHAHGAYRLVHQAEDGSRRVIPMIPRESQSQENGAPGASEDCAPLPRTVDNVAAKAQLISGVDGAKHLLVLRGKKPHANTRISIKAAQYVKQPEYWRIDALECRSGDINLPAVAPYFFYEEISSIGTEGIELHWADGETQSIDTGQ